MPKKIHRNDVNVSYPKCPFSEGTGTGNVPSTQIWCEGIEEHSKLAMRFSAKKYADEYKRNFCASDCYEGCLLYQLIMQNKY